MRVLLEGLPPRLFPQREFQCLHHEGKPDLEKSIPRAPTKKSRCLPAAALGEAGGRGRGRSGQIDFLPLPSTHSS
jgi:hypothetical protein